MSLNIELDSFNFGDELKVPPYRLAKLMYYLNCVFNVIQYSQDKKYTDYNNYYLLNEEDEEIVKKLCLTFNPKVLLEQEVFKIDKSI